MVSAACFPHFFCFTFCLLACACCRYYIKNYRQDIIICFAIGIVFRIIAFGLMAGMDREKKL